MTPAEERFKHLHRRRFFILRPSWPDFLCIERSSGKLVSVEVKSPTDNCSSNQIVTFDWLTDHGTLPVFIWRREVPKQLWPWDRVREIEYEQRRDSHSE